MKALMETKKFPLGLFYIFLYNEKEKRKKMNFNYNLPVNLVFGRGRISEIGEITVTYGKKALVVTGHSSTKKSGLLDRTISYLQTAGVESIVFDNVSQNPLTTTVIEGADLAKKEKCDVIIGLGGGSIMDCAKAVAFICKNDGDISDFIFGKKKSEEALPVILVPTTCGTGSEGNGFAVLTNPENGDKKSLRCNAIIAKASIIDSECMMTMPKNILASVGFDALCHSMEAYISRISQPMTDMMALQAMELIGKHLVSLYEGSGEAQSWDAISWASIAGCPDKFARISQCLGGKDETDCLERLRTLLFKLDLTTTLSAQGVLEEDVDWMVENCFKVSAAGINNHPIIFNEKQIKELYLKAL